MGPLKIKFWLRHWDKHVIRGLTAMFNHHRVKVSHLYVFCFANFHIQVILNNSCARKGKQEINSVFMLGYLCSQLLTPEAHPQAVFHREHRIDSSFASPCPSTDTYTQNVKISFSASIIVNGVGYLNHWENKNGYVSLYWIRAFDLKVTAAYKYALYVNTPWICDPSHHYFKVWYVQTKCSLNLFES